MPSSDPNSLLARYQRAEALEQGVFTKEIAFNTTLYPHWIGETDSFWYVRETRNGQTFRRVDANTGSNTAAFDHDLLAKALSAASGNAVAADNLPITALDLSDAPATLVFSALNQRWCYQQSTQQCAPVDAVPADWAISPDGNKAAFTRDNNLWLRDLASGEETALTEDGERFRRYASSPTVYGREEAPLLDLLWSADSKRIVTQLIDTRNIKIAPPLVQHVPTDGSLRPNILNADRRVAYADDEHIEAWTILAIDISSGDCQWADYPPCPVVYPPYQGFFPANRGWWEADHRHMCFIDEPRGGKSIRVLRFDTSTGQTTTLIEETTDTKLTLVPMTHMRTLATPLVDSNELIWFSERSGWAQLYLYDLASGELKHPITQGEWLVRNVLHLDHKRRELLIQTAGRVAGRNPYYCDICRVNIDTGELTELLSSDHEYVCLDQRSRLSAGYPEAKAVSASANFVVTTRSRVDEVPVSVLLDRQGKTLLTLETADTSALPDNWQWPEPVMLKAADGETDIYGVVFRPSDFDPAQSYPVLDCTYFYSAPAGSFSNANTGNWFYLSPAAYAELGFIVVMINNRGNDGLRDSRFNHYQDPTLPISHTVFARYNKADCVAGIQQLAERYSYIDTSRVGVVDFGSIPQALSGLLVHPEFYTVGVSNNPMADTRLVCAMNRGPEEAPEFEQLAHHLQGKLLLIAGMMDDVLPVTMTFRMVEALQKANKNFDMLLLPNLGHSTTGYVLRRSWDYVVAHLRQEQPPADFKLTTSIDLMMQPQGDSDHD